MEGETFCTGSEFLLALKLGCKVEIRGGVWIPFCTMKTPPTTTKPKPVNKNHFVREPFLLDLITDLNKNITFFDKEVSIKSKTDGVNYRYLQQKMKVEKTDDSSHFYSVVEKVLLERIKYPKGSYMNLLYKFIANAGIGQMARGLNQKTRYDLQSNGQKPIPSGELVSPLYAG